ncbi:MAG TPA: ribonuclease, partial [Cytophagales bacterium]|nr:ribonuclease [Cytophagales bacterium]
MAKTKKENKVFVLDTSVIIYEHNSILNFDEHDIGIPITVLEELDNFKKGNDTKNFEAREFIRLIDKLAKDQMLHNWNPLNGKGKGRFKVLMDTGSNGSLDANRIFNEDKADHRILNSALLLQKEEKGKKVILVSKDVNLRLKAKALGLQAEDYTTGKIQKDRKS